MSSVAAIDQTHDPHLRSWVADANGHQDFPIQNLPFGVFRPFGGTPRGGIAIGDHILDLGALFLAGFLDAEAQAYCEVAANPPLNAFLSVGAGPRTALRRAVSSLLAAGAPEHPELMHPSADCVLELPVSIGDYTDFYAGIHHATNVGRLFRPENPLLPNYKWVPIAYHGRASSVRASGTGVVRPNGQRKLPHEAAPIFGPARNLDFELELGIWVGPGNPLGEPIPIGRAHEHIAGFCLLNDWSARDIQTWEYQPLGPFLAKSFHTTVSPWIVTPEALAPFRRSQLPREVNDPAPLPYLLDQAEQKRGALDIDLEVLLLTAQMKQSGIAPQRLALSNARHLYWTPQQLLTHHMSNGCNLAAGDLLGTGTISSPAATGMGSLLEITRGGLDPVTLQSGESRRFLEDGDEIMLRAIAGRDGYIPIGFGECRATVLPAPRLRPPE